MKKLFLAAALVVAIGIQPLFAQLTPVLTDYYGVKDALVAGDPKAAATSAAAMLKAVGEVDMKALAEKDHMAFMQLKDKLSFDARHISESSDIAHQREHFATLSTNMAALAKQASLSTQPIYEEYCPMKKSYWLSSESAIKNPYFGSSMLTCGKVTATFKP